MTTGSISHLPIALGSVLAALVGSGFRWCAEQFIRAPLAVSGVVLVSGLTLMGGANALFLQENRHPAPIFADRAFQTQVSGPAYVPPRVEPVIQEQNTQPQADVSQSSAQTEQTQQAAPAQQTPAEPQRREIVNADIAQMQEKLREMGHFEGTVDGLYGPKTADAIRAFEAQFGLPRSGAATPEVLQAIKDAPVDGPQAAVAPAPATPAPAPTAQPAEIFDPAQQTVQVAEANMGDLGALIASDGDAGALIAAAPSQPMPAPIDANAQQASAPVETRTATAESVPPARDRDLVSEVQRGLVRLGFLQAPVDGVAGETTARAIRQFQIFHNYRPTGEVSLDLVDMLEAAGAYM